MTSPLDELVLHDDAFVEIPGLRGLRVARIQQRGGREDGKSLEVIEGAKDVVIPAMTHPSGESGRVLSGALRFMQEGRVQELRAGDRWQVGAGQAQGPHVILEDGTRVAILRDGRSAFDLA